MSVLLLDDELRAARECRLTTIGRVSGQPREIPIWFAAVGDTVFILAGGRERSHWVQNVIANPEVMIRTGRRTFAGRGRPVEGEADDPTARAAIAAKYGTTGLQKWLRESLPVRIDLDREVA
jgi:deazaflavin-dependent oxidoreductase (nitroreductase family)